MTGLMSSTGVPLIASSLATNSLLPKTRTMRQMVLPIRLGRFLPRCAKMPTAGQAWTCGGSSGGQQGDGTTGGTSTGTKVGPLKVAQTVPFFSVAMGISAAAIGLDGSVWTWGPQGSGVQGDGNLNASGANLSPKQISINAGDPSKVPPIFSGTQGLANSDGTTSLDVGVMFSPEHWSKTGQAYVAALLPSGLLYFYTATGWRQYDANAPFPVAYQGSLSGMLPLSLGACRT